MIPITTEYQTLYLTIFVFSLTWLSLKKWKYPFRSGGWVSMDFIPWFDILEPFWTETRELEGYWGICNITKEKMWTEKSRGTASFSR